MGVEGDVGNHQAYGATRFTIEHRPALISPLIPVPDDIHTAFLCIDRVREVFYHHIEDDLIERALLCKRLHIPGMALLVDLLEGHPAFLHERDRDRPVVECRSECHGAIHGIKFPACIVCLLVHPLDEPVDLVNDPPEPDLHLHLVDLKLVDQTVHLVDEQHWPDTLLEGLPQHGLCLRHCALDCIDHHNCPVNCPHGTGHIAPEIDMARSVDHIDQELFSPIFMDHGHVARIDGDPPRLFLLIRIHEELLACEFLAYHPRAGEKVIGERGLSMIDMSDDSDIPDAVRLIHERGHTLYHLLSSRHNETPKKIF